VLVSVALVCQYHVSPTGGVPVAVIVTPGLAHCGEFEVGLAGSAGCAATVCDIITIPNKNARGRTTFLLVLPVVLPLTDFLSCVKNRLIVFVFGLRIIQDDLSGILLPLDYKGKRHEKMKPA
jgi:hypothetical protein